MGKRLHGLFSFFCVLLLVLWPFKLTVLSPFKRPWISLVFDLTSVFARAMRLRLKMIKNGDFMSRLLSTLSLVAGLAIGGALQAQEASDGTPTVDPSVGLDLGQTVQEDPSYVKEVYDDWQLQCFRSDAEQDPCQMYQLLREEAGNPVAEFSIFKLPEDSAVVAGATIVVPLGTLLPAGLQMYVDSGAAKAYNYSFCSMIGCFARIGFTQEDIDAFRSGEIAFIVIAPAQAPDQTVLIEASLKGFTAAFDNVTVNAN